MTFLSRLSLGSAQFGHAYGVSNRDGRPSEAEVAAILERACAAGVGYVDTAPGYGVAEQLIGRHLPRGHGLRLVTKLPPIPDADIQQRHVRVLVDAVEGSIERLRVDRLHGVLVHHSAELAKPGWQFIADALREAQARGLTRHVGASVYDASEIALARTRLPMGIVQLPFNVLDRRLAMSGELARLEADGVEIHARSIFLQGLLLMEPAELPQHFASLREPIGGLHARWRRRGLSALAGCLAFALGQDAIDVAIVGVNRVDELIEIENAVEHLGEAVAELDRGVEIDPMYLNPSRWPSFA